MSKFNKETYTVAHSSYFHNIFSSLITAGRKKMLNVMKKHIPLDSLNSIIDVGVTSDKSNKDSNYFTKCLPNDKLKNYVAFSNEDASWMEEEYKGCTFKQGDACNMPFSDDQFDLVFSNAVIEHVGSRERQKQFLSECLRISKNYLFITTPNRWYPIEFHTMLPFIHYLPVKIYRKILQLLGKDFFSKEENLNLLTKSQISTLLSEIIQEKKNNLDHFDKKTARQDIADDRLVCERQVAVGEGGKKGEGERIEFSIEYSYFFFMPANLCIIIKKY